ncbi:MAG: bifunctional 2-polyprenyl-6-hydroxyphenol methylase/3-demethylubiquinol 3-O-methyltransferase UbiG [Legionellales bacterium]|nr:bifunctional 2-polyprenyl-6-hydroxyphenol methylase/3-demethylubiquinol 3-O-methyltransferase UbiG [Legionellales bacterium]
MINVDPQEIKKFNELSYDWWDEKGSFKTLHAINPLRLKFIEKQLTLQNKNILDVGCGGGILTEGLAKAGNNQVTGIDMAEQAIAIAKLHAEEQQLNIQYRVANIEEYAQTHPRAFDLVTCMELLEHVPNPLAIIKACQIMLKPQGAAFFSTINRNLSAYLQAIVGAEYLLKLLPRGTHSYERFIKPSELSQWCRQVGLSLQELQGIRYNPFTSQFSLDQNCQVNYLAYCRLEPPA